MTDSTSNEPRLSDEQVQLIRDLDRVTADHTKGELSLSDAAELLDVQMDVLVQKARALAALSWTFRFEQGGACVTAMSAYAGDPESGRSAIYFLSDTTTDQIYFGRDIIVLGRSGADAGRIEIQLTDLL